MSLSLETILFLFLFL
jgi:Na+-transporting methylmalonyl-CoA/oxaloacetate decarboxylase gamma subunit